MSTYNPLVPTGTIPLNLDYKNLQKNFNQIDITYGVDHVPLTNPDPINGYHKTIHSVPFSTAGVAPANATNQPVVAPTSVVGVSEIFTAIINDGINTASSLYHQTDTGILQQLTRNFLPTSGVKNGYTFVPGGFIIQWGEVASTASVPTPLTFSTNNIEFPNICFTVYTQPYYSAAAPSNSATVAISNIDRLGFDWKFITSSGSYNGFLWMAIGY